MKRAEIESRALSGQYLDGCDVARIARNKRAITLRYAFSYDGRVLHAVRQAYKRLARALANQSGKPVEVYSHDGIMLDQILPSSLASECL